MAKHNYAEILRERAREHGKATPEHKALNSTEYRNYKNLSRWRAKHSRVLNERKDDTA